MFRHVNTQEVIALRHAGEEFRSDGQRNGINDVYDLQRKLHLRMARECRVCHR